MAEADLFAQIEPSKFPRRAGSHDDLIFSGLEAPALNELDIAADIVGAGGDAAERYIGARAGSAFRQIDDDEQLRRGERPL